MNYRLVLATQIRENYGAHDWDGDGECPQCWKNKGGAEYHTPITEEETQDECLLNELTERMTQLFCRNDSYYVEDVIDVRVLSEKQSSPEELEDAEMVGAGFRTKQASEMYLKSLVTSREELLKRTETPS